MGDKIGRFEILRLLGKGAQSAVYLAFDPHLEREVAIKTLHFAQPDAAQNQRLLQEARVVSKLRHANIVPIFEAGEQDGDPYLVFEYVEGPTLSELLREQGALEAQRAAEILIQVLDAVAHAHRFGTIHRDLKPSNILLDPDGLARVMDFGISSPVPSGGKDTAGLMGTPAYMAPEYIAERIVGPQSDIYAAGLVLYEMVFGRRAITARGVDAIMREVVEGEITLPEDAADLRVDSRLRDVIARASAKDMQLRYASAAEMRNVLQEYLRPPEASLDAAETKEGGSGTLEFLLRRMRHKGDFPALSQAISAINRLASSDRENVSTLSNSILRDFALTNKILRLVNSAYYRTSGGGSISTVSRAIVVLGFDTIRNIAVSLILFEHLENKAHASLLREEFLRANFGGMIAKELARKSQRDTEEVFICAMFHNLGRLLAQYYFPEEVAEIQRRVAAGDGGESQASSRVLGISYQDLGMGIARNWGLPEPLVQSMEQIPAGETIRPAANRDVRLRVLAAYADEVCQVIEHGDPSHRGADLVKVRKRFGDAVGVTDDQLKAVVDVSCAEVAEFAAILRVNLRQMRLGKQLFAGARETSIPEAGAGRNTDLTAAGAVLDPRGPADLDPEAEAGQDGQPVAAVDAQAILAAGIQDISNSLVDDFSLNDVLRIILETIYRALGFRRVLLCVRDGRTQSMAGRMALGPDADSTAKKFRFPLGGTADVFNIVLAKGVDLLVHDAAESKIAPRIPDWYRKAVGAPTFLLLPLAIRGAPVALIYADKDTANEIVISEKELALLRTLRNQAVLAIKQSR